MRVSERHLRAQNNKNRLVLEIFEVSEKLEMTHESEFLDLGEMLKHLGTNLPLFHSNILTDLILSYIEDGRLTKIEAMQAIVEYLQSRLNYMLRYERHGNYETPAGLDTESE